MALSDTSSSGSSSSSSSFESSDEDTPVTTATTTVQVLEVPMIGDHPDSSSGSYTSSQQSQSSSSDSDSDSSSSSSDEISAKTAGNGIRPPPPRNSQLSSVGLHAAPASGHNGTVPRVHIRNNQTVSAVPGNSSSSSSSASDASNASGSSSYASSNDDNQSDSSQSQDQSESESSSDDFTVPAHRRPNRTRPPMQRVCCLAICLPSCYIVITLSLHCHYNCHCIVITSFII